MNINIGDGFSAKINTSNQTVELDFIGQPIITESIPQIEKQTTSFFTSIAHTITQLFMWIRNNCNCFCYSGCCRCD